MADDYVGATSLSQYMLVKRVMDGCTSERDRREATKRIILLAELVEDGSIAVGNGWEIAECDEVFEEEAPYLVGGTFEEYDTTEPEDPLLLDDPGFDDAWEDEEWDAAAGASAERQAAQRILAWLFEGGPHPYDWN